MTVRPRVPCARVYARASLSRGAPAWPAGVRCASERRGVRRRRRASATPSSSSGSRSRPVLGSVPACAVDVTEASWQTASWQTASWRSRRTGGHGRGRTRRGRRQPRRRGRRDLRRRGRGTGGRRCRRDGERDPDRCYGGGKPKPLQGPENVDECGSWVHPDELLRYLHVFPLPVPASATVRRACETEFRRFLNA